MFEIGGTELLLVAIVALLVIGPKDLPNALRTLGRYTGKARAMTRHLRAGFDEMMRQAEMEEMEKQWRDHNAEIMRNHPHVAQTSASLPAPNLDAQDVAVSAEPMTHLTSAPVASASAPVAAAAENTQFDTDASAPQGGDR